ncbi:MAG: GNAT family N-acetyltransferase [Planctomycetaceae bacterium]|nr:GNAT family N-acetyltransferase [Planctomycetaceae bacterium]
MEFIEIEWNSNLYNLEIELRDRLLRAPLGLTFSFEELESESAELHFALVDDALVQACAVIVPTSREDAKLRQMAVHENHQRKGLGSRLIHEIESVLRIRGFQQIQLHAREEAVPFYTRLGYQTVGDRFMEVGIGHWKMYRQLSKSRLH